MHLPKRYGQSKTLRCPFCSNQAIIRNKDGLPTCPAHKKRNLPDMKCACGGYLDLLSGKYGAYFNCLKCGNVSFDRALELNPITAEEPEKKESQKSDPVKPKRTVTLKSPESEYIRSDELDFI